MPSDRVLKSMGAVHRLVLKVSGGRFGWSMAGMPVIELTTTGRKSGQQRSTMLTVAWQDGETLGIVASAGGNDDHPAWFLNLSADPNVTVRMKDVTAAMTARIPDGSERADIWQQITTDYKNYAGYQKKTDREIPVVLLEPVG